MRHDFSVVVGGPFYRLLCRMRLVRAGHFSTLMPALAVWLLTFGVLAVLVGIERLATGHVDPILEDYGVFTRLCVAIPLFFLAESELHVRIARTAQHFSRGEFTTADSAATVDRLLLKVERLRDARGVEFGLFVVVWGAALMSLATPGHGIALLKDATPSAHTLARFWYAEVALPMFQFLAARWLWRWVLWSYVLVRVAQLPLRLVATHPDRAGGIALVSEPTYAFAVFAAGGCAAVAGTWGTQIERWRTELNSFAPPFVLLAVVVMLVAFGALLAFFPALRHARFDGLRDYGYLALVHNRLFHQRWIEGHDASPLGAPDISSLADLQSAHTCTAQMRLVPFGPREMIAVAAGVVLPMLPMITLAIPIKDLAIKVAHAVFGDVPH